MIRNVTHFSFLKTIMILYQCILGSFWNSLVVCAVASCFKKKRWPESFVQSELRRRGVRRNRPLPFLVAELAVSSVRVLLFCFPSFLTATRALNRPSCCVYCLGFVDFTHRSVVLWYSFILTGLLTDPKSSFVDWTVIFQLSATKLSISSHPFSTEEDILYILSLSICAIHEYDSMNIGFPFTFNE